MNRATRKQIIENIRRLAGELGSALPEANVRDTHELLEHNEWGLALDLLCTQLYEYGVALTRSQHGLVQATAALMGVDPAKWSYLEQLVSAPDGAAD